MYEVIQTREEYLRGMVIDKETIVLGRFQSLGEAIWNMKKAAQNNNCNVLEYSEDDEIPEVEVYWVPEDGECHIYSDNYTYHTIIKIIEEGEASPFQSIRLIPYNIFRKGVPLYKTVEIKVHCLDMSLKHRMKEMKSLVGYFNTWENVLWYIENYETCSIDIMDYSYAQHHKLIVMTDYSKTTYVWGE